MHVYKWSQDLMYKNNVSIKKWKEKKNRYIISSLHPSELNNIPPHKKTYTNSHHQNYSPVCHEWQRVRVSDRHLIGRASISIIIIWSIIYHALNPKGSKACEIHPKGTCRFFLLANQTIGDLFFFLFHRIRIYNHTKISPLQVRAL